MKLIASVAVALALSLAACAQSEPAPAARPVSAASAEPANRNELPSSLRAEVGSMDLAAARAALAETARQFDETLALGTPDCPLSRLLRDRICDLSVRICTLADREPGDTEIRSSCRDGAARCDRARQSVSARCP